MEYCDSGCGQNHCSRRWAVACCGGAMGAGTKSRIGNSRGARQVTDEVVVLWFSDTVLRYRMDVRGC